MSSLKLYGSTSGYVEVVPEATAGNNSVTLPNGSGTLVVGDSGGNLNISGIITATSFSGDGSALTGVSFSIGAGSTSAPSLSPTGDSNTGIFFPAADTIAFSEGGAEAARIDSSGRLLIGATSASAASPDLQINSTSEAFGTTGTLAIYGSQTNQSTGSIITQLIFGSDAASGSAGCKIAHIKGSDNQSDSLTFLTGGTSLSERMRITNGGYSKHKGGGANYYNATSNYHEFTSNQTGSVVLEVVARTTGFASVVIDTVAETTTNNTSYAFFSGSNFNGQRAAIYGNGAYGSQPNTYGGLSDIKLKENIVSASSQWDDVKNIEVVNYNLIGEEGKHLGVIAQQAEQVSPGLVDEVPDKDEEGNLTGETTKFVKYSILYMKAVKALQEAMERIETLEAEVAALKNP